jgi:GLPGLI family protein
MVLSRIRIEYTHMNHVKMKTIIRNCFTAIFAVALAITATGQARFVAQGKVEYEKKVNMHKLLNNNAWTREVKDRLPEYRITYFDLLFNSHKSAFKKGRDPVEDKWKNFWGQTARDEDLVLNEFTQGKTIALKQVFEKKFLLEDSLLNIEWRITDETREIAGFECRKAVGKFFDSLYVVAFYTDQILVPSGPEGYQGLPGLILGLAFPRFYTTWFATKVQLIEPTTAELTMPANKAKKISRAALFEQVKNAMQWGSEEQKQRDFWQTVL